MRRQDIVYLVAVALCAAVFALEVLDLAAPTPVASSSLPLHTTAGEPRDVDMDALLERIRQGHLSEHEALYARPEDPR